MYCLFGATPYAPKTPIETPLLDPSGDLRLQPSPALPNAPRKFSCGSRGADGDRSPRQTGACSSEAPSQSLAVRRITLIRTGRVLSQSAPVYGYIRLAQAYVSRGPRPGALLTDRANKTRPDG